ncbi:hypothetical protein [Streptomyces griseoviridis]|uniref:Uncharacterized protein n=1 Tax=Streptomyces griseoviridis TaxID=45398 RepID=A0ABT9LF64_STRGD|nr:hypothetical protein [Streptomyces griseoviridis]MDP9682367.1 hypothetical protein [Streptomyces griseoviridis]GGS81979.1 hypothetical protein GCM10010240_14200 [Streptomyces griseoviridis]
MATRRTPDETSAAAPAPATPEQPAPATVRTREYAAGTGWEVGQTAPADAYRALSDQGTGQVTGPVLDHHPGGYARLIVQKGAVVTEGVRRELDAAETEASATESEQG